MYNKQIFAVLASASAVKLDSEKNFLDYMGDVWTETENITYDIYSAIPPLRNFIDSTYSLGDYLFSLDGLAKDTEYIFTKDFGNDLVDSTKWFDGSGNELWTWMTEN